MRQLQAHRRDRGMTLVELVLTVAILGLITGAIGTTVMVVMKSDRATAGRLGNSRSAQSLNTWLVADVQSADPAGAFDLDSGSTAGCAGGPAFPGVNRLRIALYNPVSTSPSVVSYRVLDGQLVRVTCSTADPQPRVQVLIDGIANAADVDVSLDVTGSGIVDRVRMAITATIAGETGTFTISASPRGSVPGTTVPANPPPNPDPCILTGSSSSGAVGLSYDAVDRARSVVVPATISITTAGNCGTELRVEVETRPTWLIIFPANVETLYPGGGPNTWTLPITASVAPGLWSVGSGVKVGAVAHRSGSSWNALGNISFPVQQAPCLFTSGAVAPSPVLLSGTGTTRSVTSSATLTVNLGGVCNDVDTRVRFESRPGNTVTLNLSGTGLTRTATIATTTAAGLWSQSDKTVTVQQDLGSGYVDFTPAATFSFPTDVDACQFVGGSINPAPVLLTAAGSLNQAESITVQTTNACGTQLQATVETSGSNTQAVTLTPDATFTTWTANLATSFESGQWSAGTRDITVQRRSGSSWVEFSPQASFTYQSQALVCTVLGHTVNPDPVWLNGTGGSNRTLLASFAVSVTTNNLCGSRLRIEIETRDSGNTGTFELTNDGSGTLWTGTIPTSFENGQWQSGPRDVTVERLAGFWTTVNPDPAFQITAGSPPACTFVTGDIGEPVLLQGTGSSRSVTGSYPVSATTSGYCADIRLRINPGTGGAQSLDLSSSNGTSWTTTLDSGDFAGQWSTTSPKTATVQYLNASSNWVDFSPSATVGFTVQGAPCVFTSGSVGGTVNLVGLGASNRTITGTNTMTVATTGSCEGGIRVQFAPGTGAAQTLTLTPNGAGTSWTSTLDSGDFAGQWSVGTKNVTVQYNNGSTWLNFTPSATFTFTTQQAPCVFSTGSVSGTPIDLLGTGSARTVTGTYPLSVTTSGECGAGVRVQFTPGTGGAQTIDLGSSNGTTWTTNIDSGDFAGQWSLGTKTVTVQYFNGAAWVGFSPSATFSMTTEQAPCVFGTGSVAGTVMLSGGGGSNRSITSSNLLTVTTTGGECSAGVRVSFNPGGGTQTLNLVAGPGGTWTTTLASGVLNGQWSVGTKTVTVQYNNGSGWVGFTPAASFSFATSASCYVTDTDQSQQIGLSGSFGSSRSVNNGTTTFTITTTSGCATNMRLQFSTRTGNTVTVPLTGGPTTWTGTIGNNAFGANWSGGDRTVTIQQSTNGTTWTNVDGSSVPVTFQMDVEN